MKNPLVIGTIVILALLGGFVAYRMSAQSATQSNNTTDLIMPAENTMQKDETIMKKEDTMAKNDTMMNDEKTMDGTAATRYIPYTDEVFANSATTRRVLFFYATWCPNCKQADASFSTNVDAIPTDVTLIRVNYNDPDTDAQEKALAQKYGITYQHTYVQIDTDGNVVTKWNGGQIEELQSNIK